MGRRKSFGKYDGLKYGWLKDTKKFVLLFVVVFLLFRFVVGFSFVKGDSMEPSLKNGEMVLYLRVGEEYKVGDVVSVRVPEGEYYVKRVIAAAGDTIDLRDGKVYIDEEPLEEKYIKGETVPKEGAVRYPFTLKEGQIFVMGDNREISKDSRSFGVVGKRQIKGKILMSGGKFYIRRVQ